MRKILVTGFEPFNGRDVNPSQLVVEKLVAPADTELIKVILPVEYNRTTEILTEIVDKENPDVIFSLGQAGNVPYISVERIALNIDNSRSSDGKSLLPDAVGDAPVDRAIFSDGPDAYFTNLPIWDLVEACNKAGVPARVSYSAGTYVCNHVMYVDSILAEKHEISCGFAHVPFLPEQLIGENNFTGRYSMTLEDMVKGIQTIINMI